MAEEPWYCTACGVRLNPEHRYCWNCGAMRWEPRPGSAGAGPPIAHDPAREPSRQPGPQPAAGAAGSRSPAGPAALLGLGGVKLFFAVGAVLCLVLMAYFSALLASPVGRATLLQSSGLPPAQQGDAVQALVAVIVMLALAALLHGIAYYGIRDFRVSGWVIGVLVAGLWSLVLVGAPTLYVLLLRSTRERFGLA